MAFSSETAPCKRCCKRWRVRHLIVAPVSALPLWRDNPCMNDVIGRNLRCMSVESIPDGLFALGYLCGVAAFVLTLIRRMFH